MWNVTVVRPPNEVRGRHRERTPDWPVSQKVLLKGHSPRRNRETPLRKGSGMKVDMTSLKELANNFCLVFQAVTVKIFCPLIRSRRVVGDCVWILNPMRFTTSWTDVKSRSSVKTKGRKGQGGSTPTLMRTAAVEVHISGKRGRSTVRTASFSFHY